MGGGGRGSREVHVLTGIIWLENQKEDHLHYSGVDRRMILKRMLNKYDGRARNRFMCLGIGTGDNLL